MRRHDEVGPAVGRGGAVGRRAALAGEDPDGVALADVADGHLRVAEVLRATGPVERIVGLGGDALDLVQRRVEVHRGVACGDVLATEDIGAARGEARLREVTRAGLRRAV